MHVLTQDACVHAIESQPTWQPLSFTGPQLCRRAPPAGQPGEAPKSACSHVAGPKTALIKCLGRAAPMPAATAGVTCRAPVRLAGRVTIAAHRARWLSLHACHASPPRNVASKEEREQPVPRNVGAVLERAQPREVGAAHGRTGKGCRGGRVGKRRQVTDTCRVGSHVLHAERASNASRAKRAVN